MGTLYKRPVYTPIWPVLFAMALLCAGCFDITEELWLNKDRSGRYEMTISMASGPFASMMRMAHQKTNDSLQALGQPPRALDTLVRLGDLPDSLRHYFAHPEVLNRIVMQARTKNGLDFQFQYDFKKIEDLPLFWETLGTLGKLQKDSTIHGLDALKMPGVDESPGSLAGIPDIQFDGRTLRRTNPPDSTGQVMGSMFFDHDSDPLVKMMFNNKKYRLVFHLPKKVKAVQGAGFESDGKTVTGAFSLLDVVRDHTKLSCAITLK